MTPEASGTPRLTARRRRLSTGAISLMLLALNTAGVFWAVWVVGSAVDSGIPLFYFLASVTFPLFIFTTVPRGDCRDHKEGARSRGHHCRHLDRGVCLACLQLPGKSGLLTAAQQPIALRTHGEHV